ncbi:MAG: hypothetical protein ACOCVF_00960 [bacterium]
MIRIKYKNEVDKKIGHNKRNILSFRASVKENQLPIVQLGWEFIWLLFKHKLKHKIYFLSHHANNTLYYDFFYLPKQKK